MDNKELTKKSKYLSKLLRHSPEKANLILTSDGWVSVHQLLANTNLTMEIIEEVVITNNKKDLNLTKTNHKFGLVKDIALKLI